PGTALALAQRRDARARRRAAPDRDTRAHHMAQPGRRRAGARDADRDAGQTGGPVSMRRARRARQSGVALIAVLWLLVILGLLSSALLTSTHFDALAPSNERCRLQASYAAQAGVADATEQLDRWLAVAQVAARGGTPDRK